METKKGEEGNEKRGEKRRAGKKESPEALKEESTRGEILKSYREPWRLGWALGRRKRHSPWCLLSQPATLSSPTRRLCSGQLFLPQTLALGARRGFPARSHTHHSSELRISAGPRAGTRMPSLCSGGTWQCSTPPTRCRHAVYAPSPGSKKQSDSLSGVAAEENPQNKRSAIRPSARSEEKLEQ